MNIKSNDKIDII